MEHSLVLPGRELSLAERQAVLQQLECIAQIGQTAIVPIRLLGERCMCADDTSRRRSVKVKVRKPARGYFVTMCSCRTVVLVVHKSVSGFASACG